MVSILRVLGALCIFSHAAVYVHAGSSNSAANKDMMAKIWTGHKYSFVVVEGHDVHFPIPKHCLNGHFLLDNENQVIAKFNRDLFQPNSGRGKLNDGCFGKMSNRCDFRMKVRSVRESGTYRLYHTSLSEAPYPCDIVYSLEVWPGTHYVVTGKLEGILNGVELKDLSIVGSCNKVCNLSIDSLERQAGLPITMLMSTDLFELIGWMFAVSDNNEMRNGYSLTGGFCHRTATIRYPNRRTVTVSQDFYGIRSEKNEFRLDTIVNGTIPLKHLLAKNVKSHFNAIDSFSIPVHEYENIYRRTSESLMEMTSVRTRPFVDDTLNYTIDQTIRFTRPWASRFNDIALLKHVKLSFTNIWVSYQSTDMQARLKMNSKISIWEDKILAEDEDPEVGLKNHMQMSTHSMSIERIIWVLMICIILSALLCSAYYCLLKKKRRVVRGRNSAVVSASNTSRKDVEEPQILYQDNENMYISIGSVDKDMDDQKDKFYITPVFDSYQGGSPDEYTAQSFPLLSTTNLKEVVSDSATGHEDMNRKTGKDHSIYDTNLKKAGDNNSDRPTYEDINSRTVKKEVVGNASDLYEKINSNTHLKQRVEAEETNFFKESASLQPNSNMDHSGETNLKQVYTSIYYDARFLQYGDTPNIGALPAFDHEYETITTTLND